VYIYKKFSSVAQMRFEMFTVYCTYRSYMNSVVLYSDWTDRMPDSSAFRHFYIYVHGHWHGHAALTWTCNMDMDMQYGHGHVA
jgi:hypothetical protein